MISVLCDQMGQLYTVYDLYYVWQYSMVHMQITVTKTKTTSTPLETKAIATVDDIEEVNVMCKIKLAASSTLRKESEAATNTLVKEIGVVSFFYNFGFRNLSKETSSAQKSPKYKGTKCFG